MKKELYNYSHLQPDQTGSSKEIDIEDSYSMDEELVFGIGEQAKQNKQVDHFVHGKQVNNIQMTRNETELDREVRETLRAIRDGLNDVDDALQQLAINIQQLAPVNRRALSHHSGGNSVVGSPRAIRAPTRNTDRPLMPVFNAKEEAAPPTTPNLLPDNVMAIYDEWDLFPDPIK